MTSGYLFNAVPLGSVEYGLLHRELCAQHMLVAFTPPDDRDREPESRLSILRHLIYQTIARCHYPLIQDYAAKKQLTKQHRPRVERGQESKEEQAFQQKLTGDLILGENLEIAFRASVSLAQSLRLRLGGDIHCLSRELLCSAIRGAATDRARKILGREKDRRPRAADSKQAAVQPNSEDVAVEPEASVDLQSGSKRKFVDISEVAADAERVCQEDLITVRDLLSEVLELPPEFDGLKGDRLFQGAQEMREGILSQLKRVMTELTSTANKTEKTELYPRRYGSLEAYLWGEQLSPNDYADVNWCAHQLAHRWPWNKWTIRAIFEILRDLSVTYKPQDEPGKASGTKPSRKTLPNYQVVFRDFERWMRQREPSFVDVANAIRHGDLGSLESLAQQLKSRPIQTRIMHAHPPLPAFALHSEPLATVLCELADHYEVFVKSRLPSKGVTP